MYHYVYQITNLLNNMIYVGKRSSKKHPDIDTYFGSGVHLKSAIKKYGKANFKKEIIAIVDSAEEAEALEEKIVVTGFIVRKDTYNIALGGKGGNLGDEVNSKISKSHKGKKLSEETKAKMSVAHKGKKFSEEHKEKISEVQKGKKLSDKTKSNISEAMSGRIWINDGKISKCVKQDEVDKYIAYGFTLGRIVTNVEPPVMRHFRTDKN